MNAAASYRHVDQMSRVGAASAHGLVEILLSEALEQITVADSLLARKRSVLTVNARLQGILHALEASLDHSAGGTTARLMDAVYQETRRCMARAAAENDPEWIKRAEGTLRPVAEAWREIAQAA